MIQSKKAFFRFYAELNDFLPENRKAQTFSYPFTGSPAIKDTIEAIGVPHSEIDLILVNSRSVDFNYQIKNNDRISVYPVFELFDIRSTTRLRPIPLREPKFILDINLGKLVKYLRLLGFDSLYQNDYEDIEIIKTAQNTRRIILTRDIGLLKNKLVTHGYWVRSTIPKIQIVEVATKFDLFSKIKPFQICLSCNGEIIAVNKSKVIDKLPPRTKLYFNDFFECQSCRKIYWKGTHYERMLQIVEDIKKENKSGISKKIF
jgi:uncharacterized protein with PIN domain